MMLNAIYSWDSQVQAIIQSYQSDTANAFFTTVTHCGDAITISALSVISVLLLMRLCRWWTVFCFSGSMLLFWGLMEGIKLWVGRDRPLGITLIQVGGYSFPSGHAMLSTVFYGVMAWWCWKKWPNWRGRCLAVILIMLIGLIAFSRLYVNVHFFSDVIAGIIMGSLCLWGMITLLRRVSCLDETDERGN